MDRRAQEANSPAIRADYLKTAEGWRDLARRVAETERRDSRSGP